MGRKSVLQPVATKGLKTRAHEGLQVLLLAPLFYKNATNEESAFQKKVFRDEDRGGRKNFPPHAYSGNKTSVGFIFVFKD